MHSASRQHPHATMIRTTGNEIYAQGILSRAAQSYVFYLSFFVPCKYGMSG